MQFILNCPVAVSIFNCGTTVPHTYLSNPELVLVHPILFHSNRIHLTTPLAEFMFGRQSSVLDVTKSRLIYIYSS